jgi:predicted permease
VQFPDTSQFSVSPANYLDWRERNRVFAHLAAYGTGSLILPDGDRSEAIRAVGATPELFDVLGVHPGLGRAFTAEEDQPGRDNVVVLGDALWRSRFGADRGLIGRDLRLGGKVYTVIGVMPPGFNFPDGAQMWVPMAWNAEERALRGVHDYFAVARLAPGTDLEAAQTHMDLIARALEEEYPADNKGWGVLLVPLRDDLVGEVRPALLMLLGAVVFVLLIACANVAHLLLARTLARRKEIALRMALGAGRGRVLQQVICEALVLSLAGGALGLLLAGAGVGSITAFLGNRLPAVLEVRPDARILLFTLAVALVTGLLAGLIPAWRLTQTPLYEALKQGAGRTVADAGGHRTRRALVVSEVALSVVLLVGAGLMLRSLWLLRSVDPGFDPRQTLGMTLALPAAIYPQPQDWARFYERVLDRVRALPGVESTGAISEPPLSNSGSTQPVAIEGRPAAALSELPAVAVREITPGYVRAMRIPLLRGRDLTDADTADRPAVVLVSDSLARHYWPDQDPIGKRLELPFNPGITRTVVGVVGDVKHYGLHLRAPIPTVYNAMTQIPRPVMSLVVRASSSNDDLVPTLIGALREVDPEQPPLEVMTLQERVDRSLSHERLSMLLLAGFAGFATLLAGVGIYSVVAYDVRRRANEIGVRLALGARRADISRLIVVQGLRMTLAGLVIGLAIAAALTRLVTSLLFGVRPTDPPTLAAVALLVGLCALLACYLPARRAARVEPMTALRCE